MIAPTLACACWSGYEVITALAQNRWNFLLRLFSGIPFGMMYQSLFVFILQYYIPWGFKQGIIVIISFSLFSFLLHLYNQRYVHPSLKIRMKVYEIFLLLLFMTFIFYRLCLIYFNEGRYTRGAAYSDFSFHTELVSSFAIGCNVNRSSLFGILTPMSAGTKLSYPVLVNFYSAFLYSSCGVNFPTAFRWPALLNGISFVFIIYSLTMLYTSDSIAALISLPLWAFSGGLGFLEVFDYGLAPLGSSSNYIHEFFNNSKAFWFQSLTHIFHPQRCATFALPLCYTAISSLITGIEKFEWRFFLLSALAVGITPQTQAHAYVSLAVFSLALAFFTFPFPLKIKIENSQISFNFECTNLIFKAIFCWSIFGIVANVIAFPLCLPFFERTVSNQDFLTFKPIWKDKNYVKPPFAFLKLWWKSLGPFGLISLIFGFATASVKQIRIYLASLTVFMVGSTIMFQPWELDNCKVFQDGWMPIAIGFVSQFFTRILYRSRSKFIDVSLLILFIASIASGILNLVTYEGFNAPIYSLADEQAGKWIAENTPVDSVFYQTMTEVMAPSASYAGRSLLFGYGGWMSSHGVINYTIMGSLNKIALAESPELNKAFNFSYLMKNSHEQVKNVVDANSMNAQQIIESIENKSYYQKIMEFEQYFLFKFIEGKDTFKDVEEKKKNRPKKKKPLYTFHLEY